MRKRVLMACGVVVLMLGFAVPAYGQQASFRERGIDLGAGGGKTGIGPGYVISATFHLFPRESIYPIGQCSWTPSATVSGKRLDALGGGSAKISGSQCSVGVGFEFMMKRWKRWELDLAAENGFQKTTFHYAAALSSLTFHGSEKSGGYYFLPESKVKYWFTKDSNVSVTFGMVSVGDPTGGDELGRTVFLIKYTHRFDPEKLFRLFRSY